MIRKLTTRLHPTVCIPPPPPSTFAIKKKLCQNYHDPVTHTTSPPLARPLAHAYFPLPPVAPLVILQPAFVNGHTHTTVRPESDQHPSPGPDQARTL